MLALETKQWAALRHAYGSAENIPALLAQLGTLPTSLGNAEPWISLWSALAHQGDVYSASFAAVPHVIEALALRPEKADHAFFHFPAWVEICRVKHKIEVPEALREAYFLALARLPSLVAEASNREWDSGFLACTLAAIAAAKGQTIVAEAVLEFASADVAKDFIDWLNTR